MKMRDKEFDKLLSETMKWEADRIMEEVESDPELKDVVAPESIHENLMKQIQEKKENDKKKLEPHKRLTPDEQELIRLGIKYRKNHGKGKYFILVAAIVCALGVGTISIGGKEKVVTEVKRIFSGREQTVVNTGDDDKVKAQDVLTEENAFEEINDKFGFWAVRMYYMPDGVELLEAVIKEEIQSASLYYSDSKDVIISYHVTTDYRNGSVSMDVEDKLIQEYEKKVNDIAISLQEYEVEENNTKRWIANFVYGNAQYSIMIMGLEKQEVEKVVENLYFS